METVAEGATDPLRQSATMDPDMIFPLSPLPIASDVAPPHFVSFRKNLLRPFRFIILDGDPIHLLIMPKLALFIAFPVANY